MTHQRISESTHYVLRRQPQVASNYASCIMHHVSRITGNYKLLYVLCFTLLLILVSCAPPTISGAPLAEGNQFYEAGEYAQAIAAYQSLVESGVEDGTLYYNLGNAYFKNGDLGRAILNYRRAEQLLPRDPDVADNLQLARAQTQDQLDAGGGDGLATFITDALIGWTTVNEAAGIALGLWILLCGVLFTALLWPRGRSVLRYIVIACAVVWLLSVLSVGIRVLEARDTVPAVIVAESAEVRSGPGDDYLNEFTLHAGAEVHVVEQRETWVRIALPGDLQGWVSEGSIDKL
ncbi:MAG: tetratricopeptide repeat protein [Anaerolineae bacterium]|nr:tetratricopeptide repeat protein [Anaerolineae bacterium]